MSNYLPQNPCRCGWDGTGAHPCHRCHTRPGRSRLYAPTMRFSLAGMQPKLSVRDTNACDECWVPFAKALEAQHERERAEFAALQASGVFDDPTSRSK